MLEGDEKLAAQHLCMALPYWHSQLHSSLAVMAVTQGFCHAQKADLAEDLETTSVEEFQSWLEGMDQNVTDLRRKIGVSDRSILSKKQLIEANKAQYTRVRLLSLQGQAAIMV